MQKIITAILSTYSSCIFAGREEDIAYYGDLSGFLLLVPIWLAMLGSHYGNKWWAIVGGVAGVFLIFVFTKFFIFIILLSFSLKMWFDGGVIGKVYASILLLFSCSLLFISGGQEKKLPQQIPSQHAVQSQPTQNTQQMDPKDNPFLVELEWQRVQSEFFKAHPEFTKQPEYNALVSTLVEISNQPESANKTAEQLINEAANRVMQVRQQPVQTVQPNQELPNKPQPSKPNPKTEPQPRRLSEEEAFARARKEMQEQDAREQAELNDRIQEQDETQ